MASRTTALFALLIGCSDASEDKPADHTEPGATAGEFVVLSYNVHGLPPVITGDDTPDRMIQIAPRLVDWDIVGLQEDWDADNHENLVGETEHPTKLWFNETLSEERYYGSGLSVLSVYPAIEVVNTHYTTCSGVLDGASDCLASKGFQAVRLQVGAGTIDLYNTHFEAGGGTEDDLARSVQVGDVVEALNGWSMGHAVIFTGDFNLHASDPEDLVELVRLKEDGGLVDACTSIDCSEPDHIDRVFFRSSPQMALQATDWANHSPEFLDSEGTDLSDHPPISATISWAVVD